MKLFVIRLLTILLMSSPALVSTSCSDDDDEPKNQINDARGLQFDLTWTTGSTDADAIDDIDIDLYFVKEQNILFASTSGWRFDSIETAPELPDGEYLVRIALLGTQENGTYNLNIEGRSKHKQYRVTRDFVPGNSENVDLLTITKKGSMYIIEPIDN